MKNLVWSLLLINVVRVFVSADTTDMNWPVVTKENKPWSYWWWMGNAVDDENLTDLLEQYQAANFGGLHIIPIYGVKGEEERYIDFLSRSWMDRLAHTVREARRLDMGVDMSTGTGWPFGGPMVTLTEAAERILLESYSLGAGETLDKLLPGGRLVLVQARNDAGEIIDVTDKVKERRLAWTPAEGNWRLYVLAAVPTGQKVKRAAPGGQGRVLNPYSHQAMLCYLQAFDKAFVNYTAPMPRAQYHDSFEYFRANWMDDFFQEFHTRRGYDLREYLPAFFGEGDKDAVARVKGDYRRTISDLHIEYIKTWAAWAHGKGCLARDQAHGAPANLLDTYAAADIPETEIFGPSGFPIPGLRTDTGFNNEPPDPLALKFASSAAHVAGHPLCSSETCTWLGEHFQVALSQAKPEVDQLFICGVNHIFYHGMAYSPLDEAWPGWLFYASTSFAPSNTFWRELGALNKYITRCQSILQSGSPANDILLYYPIEDIWHDEEGLNKSMSVHSLSYWLHGRDYYKTGQWMWEQGYGFDYVSDAQLQKSTIQQKQICTEGGQNYQTIIVVCHLMPVETQAKLFVLANEGAAVIFVGGIPEDVSGWGNLARQRQQMHKLWENVTFNAVDEDVQQAVIGKGCLLKGANLSSLLKAVGVKREKLADTGLKFIRRKHDQGYHYFITNLTGESVDTMVELGTKMQSAVFLDPMFENRVGKACLEPDEQGKVSVRIQLASGQSCILRTFTQREINGPAWKYIKPIKDIQPIQLGESVKGNDAAAKIIKQPWRITFLEGGEILPASFETSILDSWTKREDQAYQYFSGTARYAFTFELPENVSEEWMLDLGTVYEAATVTINGREAGHLFSFPFRMTVSDYVRSGENILEIDVTNLPANRIIKMDKEGVNWKRFHEINFVNINYRPFDASNWPIFPSGLIGPVRLVPVKRAGKQ